MSFYILISVPVPPSVSSRESASRASPAKTAGEKAWERASDWPLPLIFRRGPLSSIKSRLGFTG